MNTKLILVEGLPGFGKSTTANLIYEILTENKIEAELFLEGNLDHPADYDGVACFTKDEFDSLLDSSGNLKDIFKERVMIKGENYLLPYQKIKKEYNEIFTDKLFQTIFKKDIYELPLEKNMELIVANWAEFADKALNDSKVYIIECCFIQNPLTIGMVKYGEEKDIVINYVMKLAQTVERLNPVLFYVEQDDLDYSFKKAVEERPKEWSAGFIQYYTNQGYGKNHNLTGIDGTIQVVEARRQIESEIFKRLDMRKEKVNNSNFNIGNHKELLMGKLKGFEI